MPVDVPCYTSMLVPPIGSTLLVPMQYAAWSSLNKIGRSSSPDSHLEMDPDQSTGRFVVDRALHIKLVQ